ncbi:MAG: G5 domain-containing protein [Anaerolineae bacterium]|nr:G5 domain-containing protein [Anaerolineae bacterium]
MNRYGFILLILLIFAGCVPAPEDTDMQITVIADGRQRVWVYDQQISVQQFLEQIGITLGELDRVNPPEYTQIQDGMTITVRRVEERVDCEDEILPYQTETVAIEGLDPGAQQLGQPGVNGIQQVCYRVIVEDGEDQQRIEVRRVPVEAPQNEVIYVGVDTSSITPVPIAGTLAYLSNGNAWVMRGSSSTKRPITNTGALDGRVFSLSVDGRQLLYSQTYNGEEEAVYFNTLWAILNTSADQPEPLQLNALNNILYGEWVPGQAATFSYSAGEARDAAPGWQAFNDLWIMRIDESSGNLIAPRNLVESSSGGTYGWWGTTFRWSPDGSALAWSRADSVGLVDLETGEFQPLLEFAVYATYQDWVWQPPLAWSPDNLIIATTVHGAPFGTEQPENSPIFNVAVTPIDGTFQADVVERAGMWAIPQFSSYSGEGDATRGYLAYLQARNPLNSVNDVYDLVVADRDGSNGRVIFPEPSEPGITSPEFVWGPDGLEVAVIYQGNLWVVDVVSGRAHQLTVDGGASSPRWTR